MTADTAELRFESMGTPVHLIGVGCGDTVLGGARAWIDDLSRRWSRFDPDSEVNRINRSGGTPVRVSHETAALVERAVEGWLLTDGRFDPTVLGDVVRAGYDRDRADLGRDGTSPIAIAAYHALLVRGCDGIEVDRANAAVVVPPGVGFDPGAIGKGLAADWTALALVEAGARGACVNIGGDIRMLGQAPGGGPWIVAIDDPDSPGKAVAQLALASGAVATTRAQHVIDPRSGTATDHSVGSVTVVAGDGVTAEIAATSAFVAFSEGPRAGLTMAASFGGAALAVHHDGSTELGPGMTTYVVEGEPAQR